MPRMRLAMRAGWKSSSASTFSPAPISLIGLPVTARIDSAAPPRPSPSMRVSTMPVMPTRPSKARAVYRVLAGQAVGDEQYFVRIGGGLDLGHLGHHRLVDRGAAGRVEHDHVVTAEARRARSRAGRSARRSGRRRSAAVGCRSGCRARRAAPLRPGGGCRARPSAPCLPVGQALGDLRRRRRLAGALQAHHQDRHGRHGVEVEIGSPRRPASRSSRR